MAGGAVGHDATLAVVVLGLLPVRVSLLVVVAAHTILIGGSACHRPSHRQHSTYTNRQPAKASEYDHFFPASHSRVPNLLKTNSVNLHKTFQNANFFRGGFFL